MICDGQNESQKYLWDSDTESTVTDAFEERPIKKRKVFKNLRFTVEFTDVHKQDIDDFTYESKKI